MLIIRIQLISLEVTKNGHGYELTLKAYGLFFDKLSSEWLSGIMLCINLLT